MVATNKYKKGSLIKSMAEIARLIQEKQYMMIDNFSDGWVPIHHEIVDNMTFRTIWKLIGKGKGSRFAYADLNSKSTEGK